MRRRAVLGAVQLVDIADSSDVRSQVRLEQYGFTQNRDSQITSHLAGMSASDHAARI